MFAPSAVAVVGASSDPSKRGHQILRALGEAGFRGPVFAVNPRGGEILGHRVYLSVEDLPQAPDLAVLCTPAAAAPELVARCGQQGIRAVVVLAVGFGESGEEGRVLEERALTAARSSGIRLVGPNTSGLLNLPLGLNLIGARDVRAGSLSLLVQSGNMALTMLREATERSWEGIRICVGLGNGRDVGFAEGLDYLADDPGTRAVVCHMEGTDRMAGFVEAAARCARRKPVVLLKAGRSGAGAAAARSHTGAVTGSYDRFSAAMAQAGVTEVRRSDELLHVAETLAWQPLPPPATGVAILADGGGQGTLAADVLSELGVPLAGLGEATRARLRALLGPAASTANPVDVAGAGDADPRIFPAALELLVSDPAVGAVLLVGLFGGYGIRFSDSLAGMEEQAGADLVRIAGAAGRALVVHSIYALHRTPALARVGSGHVPVISSLEVACSSVAHLWARRRRLSAGAWKPRPPHGGPEGSSPPAPVLARGLAQGRTTLTEPEARALLQDAGLHFPPSRVCRTAAEAVAAWREWGPLALKVVSPEIPHKSEVDGVALGLGTRGSVEEAFRRLRDRALDHLAAGSGTLEGVLATPMQPSPLLELVVGAEADPDLGFVVTLGAGGIWVEVLRDVSRRVLHLDRDDVVEMLREVRVGAILEGGRGRPPGDRDGVVDAVLAVARCVEAHPLVGEVEVNPLFVYPDRVVPVDARVYLHPPSATATPSA